MSGAYGAATLRAQVLGRLGGAEPHTVLVAPLDSGDDAAAVAAGLAESLAATARAVVLVELPGSDGGMARRYDVTSGRGLAEVLRESSGPTATPDVGGMKGLTVVVEGGGGADAEDLASSATATEYLTSIRDAGAWVVALSGPATGSAVALTVGPECDGVVLVATDGETDRVRAARVVAQMTGARTRVLGVVMGPVAVDANAV
jgi:Mrp family chromosome partitioning ATPase